jgi:hypothetical protein
LSSFVRSKISSSLATSAGIRSEILEVEEPLGSFPLRRKKISPITMIMLPKIEVTRIITVKQTSLDFSHNGQFEKIKKIMSFSIVFLSAVS